MRWCWVNFQCRGVLLIWIIVGQGLTALAVGAGGGCLGIFSLVYHFYLLSPSLWETARYRLKYCLKGPLSPKQPTNQPTSNSTKRSSRHLQRYSRHWKVWLYGETSSKYLRKNARNKKYSGLSLSRLRLSRITAYLEEKIWSFLNFRNLTPGNKYCG